MNSETQTPLVSVVMTTYREKWPRLERAVQSILSQTLSDFEFIIVFEGEDENEHKLAEKFSDPRIVVCKMPQGHGRSPCHNAGLALARGRYLARMDDDDFCYPERLATEVAYLREHRDVTVVGAAGRLVNEAGAVVGARHFPQTHEEIVCRMAFVNPILHPTVLWDRMRAGKDLRYATYHVDDLELWLQLLERGRRFANLPVALIDYGQPEGRPMKSWRGVLWIRLLHWRLCLRYPRYFLGICLFLVLSVSPHAIINRITRGNRHIDRLRSIRRAAPTS
jgi:glycosyltransferase involved in cell wall biosynthesis